MLMEKGSKKRKIKYKKKTEREAARFLPLLATASAVHNFCRRFSLSTIIIHQILKMSTQRGEIYAKQNMSVFGRLYGIR